MKRIICLLFLMFLCGTAVGYLFFPAPLYGNDDAQIIKYLNKNELIKETDANNIKIVDTIYDKDTKFVGFMSDTHHGLAIYERNNDNNYVFKSLEFFNENTDSNLGIARVLYNPYDLFENSDIGWVIFSYGTEISKVELTINDTYNFSSKIDVTKPSLTIIKEDMPRNESKAISIDFKYYDLENNKHDL